MNTKWVLAGIAAALIVIPLCSAQVPQECGSLVHYRDNELFQEWESYVTRHTAAHEAKELLSDQLQRMEDETWWARSDGPTVAASVKLVADSVSNILGLTPAGGVVAAARRMGQTPHRNWVAVYQALKNGKSVKTLVFEESEIAAARILLGQAGPLGAATKLVWDAIENASKVKSAQDTKKALVTSVRRLKDETERYEKVAEESLAHADAMDAIRLGIDQYCSGRTEASYDATEQLRKPETAFDLRGKWSCRSTSVESDGSTCSSEYTAVFVGKGRTFSEKTNGRWQCRSANGKQQQWKLKRSYNVVDFEARDGKMSLRLDGTPCSGSYSGPGFFSWVCGTVEGTCQRM